MASSDPVAAEAFWIEVYGHWPLTAEESANELHDWAMALREVPKVYAELTGGRFSKPNTLAQHVIDAAREDLASELSTMETARAQEQVAITGFSHDVIHFARITHEAHHADHSGTWLTCDRGACPGVRRAISRLSEARGAASGATQEDQQR